MEIQELKDQIQTLKQRIESIELEKANLVD
jgi:prefoldin subunit 5